MATVFARAAHVNRLSAAALLNTAAGGATPSSPASKSRKSRKAAGKRRPIVRADNLHAWAHAVVYGAGAASCSLNALACYTSAASGMGLPSLCLGASVPVFVMMLFHVAGLLYRRHNTALAIKAAAVGVFLLCLSLYHCTESIRLLMTCGWPLALPLAIGLDCGLVVCEYVVVSTD
jgi:hypothetical protein